MKKTKRMMDGGMAKSMSRDEREDNDNMDEERVERREQRRERRGSDMREERRSEMMKRREARAAMTPEQRSAVRAERMAQIQKMGAGIRDSFKKGFGVLRKPSPPVAGQPGIAPPVRPIIPQAAPMPAPALQKPAMRGGGLARKGVGQALRGGGLARKGVGQALKAGGAVRACGVAKRGKTKGKMV